MILHRLIRHHAKHGPDHDFSLIQVEDSLRWLRHNGVVISSGTTALDLGCGSGVCGKALLDQGCSVTFADAADWLHPDIPREHFRRFDLDREQAGALGRYDLVICSNVLEHLRRPEQLVRGFASLLKPRGHIYLSWTNWLSPWGGHDFSPFHYLGPRLGPALFDKTVRRPRILKPYENLFPTFIGRTLRLIRHQPNLRILRTVPRYYTEFWPIMWIPLLREFLAWNCVVLIQQAGQDSRGASAKPTRATAFVKPHPDSSIRPDAHRRWDPPWLIKW